MSTEDTNAARRGSESNDLLGQASEARWYCVDRDGVAMLCRDEADALAQAIESDACWPGRAPHRAVLLGDVGYLLDGGDLIQLAQPRNEQAMRTAELCLSAWATARMDALEAENAALKREAHTWSKAAESYATDAERFRWLAEHTVATGLARWVHPFQFLAEAVDARRGLNRPPTPVGWSDTDWLKHLEEIRQNEAAYHRGPLPERGWD